MDPEDFFKEPDMSFERFLSKLYKIREFDKRVYFVLLKAKKPVRCEEVNAKLDRDQVAVYRSLQKLVKAGICKKVRLPLEEGGHFMQYSAISYDDARAQLLDKVKTWYKMSCTIIENR
jgi:predicted transcriptional regulator